MRLTDRPLASKGLISYRYRGRYGWIMIGATDDKDALRQANRSISDGSLATIDRLEVWRNDRYESVDR